MSLKHCKHLALASAVALGLAACAEEPAREGVGVGAPAAGVGVGTAAVDYGRYDADIDRFLGTYVGENEMFGDDQLEYEVREGVVTVTGEVDTQEELTALQTRIRGVPGVRDVNAGGVKVAGGATSAKPGAKPGAKP